MNKTIEKKHRLDSDLYSGLNMISFTLCIKERKKVLSEEKIFKELETILISCLNKYDCKALVYLFMPEHCHLLLQGESDNSNILDAVKAFKQKSGYFFSSNNFEFGWQKDFYDHIIRNDEDINQQIIYILYNPVRRNW
jgi:REP-associated tyrosine transposase